jgi:hypothetical protein
VSGVKDKETNSRAKKRKKRESQKNRIKSLRSAIEEKSV